MAPLQAHAAAVFFASVLAALLCVARAPRAPGPSWWDALFFACAWEPFNLRLWEAFLARATSRPFALAAALLIALALAYARGRGLRLRQGGPRAVLTQYALHLLALTPLIPVGLALGFLRAGGAPSPRHAASAASSYLLLVAPSEELVFRGLGLGVLVPALGEPAALVTVSAAFALSYSHLTGGGAFPNWTYAGFAFVCGLAYGRCYLRSRDILAPILLHGTVDLLWRLFLSAPR